MWLCRTSPPNTIPTPSTKSLRACFLLHAPPPRLFLSDTVLSWVLSPHRFGSCGEGRGFAGWSKTTVVTPSRTPTSRLTRDGAPLNGRERACLPSVLVSACYVWQARGGGLARNPRVGLERPSSDFSLAEGGRLVLTTGETFHEFGNNDGVGRPGSDRVFSESNKVDCRSSDFFFQRR